MDEIELLKNETTELLTKLDLPPKILNVEKKNETILLDVEVPKIESFLTQDTILALQHLLRLILKRKTEKNIFVDLDINSYKKKKAKYLQELAKTIADEVALTKKERILDPMPSYERRVIHLYLAQRSDVTTESIGKEPNRRVVIKPYP